MKNKAKKKDYKNKILLEINYFKYIYLFLIIKACMIKLTLNLIFHSKPFQKM